MNRNPPRGGKKANLAEALPGSMPLVFFLGGPFSAGESNWGRSLRELLRQFAEHAGEQDVMSSLLGPLGRAGFDPLNPGRVGLAASAGLALFHAPDAIGLAAAVRSPKQFREALKNAVVRRRIRKLEVPGAAEAGWGPIDEGWDVAFARRPPWLYAMFGPDVRRTGAGRLADLVAGDAGGSLASVPSFRDAVRTGGLEGDLALWVGEEVLSMAAPDPDFWKELLERGSGIAGRAGSMLDAMFHLHGAVLGGALEPQEARAEGLVLADGTWLRALETTVGQGSQCVIGPRALGRHCPAWALSVLDWTLLARTLPVVAAAIDRIAGPWGDLFKRAGVDGRANGVVAVGLCGVRPAPPGNEEIPEADVLEAVDAFLVLEMLGQNLPAQLAGRMVDVVGDVMRDGMKRLRRGDREERTSVVLAGHRFYVSVRRGAMILATSRRALEEARRMMETNRPERLPPGWLLGGAWDPQRLIRILGEMAEDEADAAGAAELLQEVRRLGAARFEVRKVPAGLRGTFRQSLLVS